MQWAFMDPHGLLGIGCTVDVADIQDPKSRLGMHIDFGNTGDVGQYQASLRNRANQKYVSVAEESTAFVMVQSATVVYNTPENIESIESVVCLRRV